MSPMPVQAPSTGIPGEALFAARERSLEVIERALESGIEPGARVTEVRAVLLRGVQGKRSAFKLELTIVHDGARTEQRRVLGKIYSKEHGARAYEVLCDLNKRGFCGGRWLVPKPLGYDAASRLLLLGWMDGVPLRHAILDGLPATEAGEKAAAWLASLHGCGTPTGRVYTFERQLHTLRGWADRIAALCPAARPRLVHLLRWIEHRGNSLAGWTAGPTHRDFSPDHLLLNGTVMAGLDFDEFCQYDRLFDVAHFVAHVRWLALAHPDAASRLETLAQSFLRAYRAAAPEYSDARVALHTAISHFKLAHITAAVTRPPDWECRLGALLDRAFRIALEVPCS